MRFRIGLALGLAAGYVLGAKAGRERYEQIRNAAERMWESQGGRRIRAEASHVVDEVRERSVETARQIGGRSGLVDVTDDAGRSLAATMTNGRNASE